MIEERIVNGIDTSIHRVMNDGGVTVRYLVKTTDNYTISIYPDQWEDFVNVVIVADQIVSEEVRRWERMMILHGSSRQYVEGWG